MDDEALEVDQDRVHFEQPAQEIALADYVHEVEHALVRIERLNLAIQEAARSAPPQMRAVMAYSGLVPSEYSTGERRVQGTITKTGNAHLRRVVMEAASGLSVPTMVGR